MITDEERRRVAKRMYDAADGTVWKGNSFCAMLARMTRAKKATRRDVIHRLADLIDRPIYEPVIPNAMEGYVFCPQCGAEIGEYGVPNYCHNCGAAIRNGH